MGKWGRKVLGHLAAPSRALLCCVCSTVFVPTPGALLLQCKCEVQLPWQQHLAGAKHYSLCKM